MRTIYLAIIAGMISAPAVADEKADAYECLNKTAARYALGSCEPAATIVVAAKASCSKEISILQRSVVNDRRMSSLSLEKRLEFADRMVAARAPAMTAIVIEARMRTGKECR